MDLLTHILLTALFGKALNLDVRIIAVLAVVSIAPDIDSVSVLFRMENWFTHHRNLFHSILGAFTISLIVCTVAYLGFFKSFDLRLIFLITIGSTLLHLSLDIINPWQLKLFYPFSDAKFSLDLFYYVDYLILPMLILANSFLYFKLFPETYKILIILVCLVLIVSVLGLRIYEKSQASKYGESLPTTNPLVWYSVRDDENIIVTKVSNGNAVDLQTYQKPKYVNVSLPIDSLDEAITRSADSELVKALLSRARYPFVDVSNSSGNYTVIWNDVAIRQIGGMIKGIEVKVYNDGKIEDRMLL
jgi:inner membrane protein